MSNLEDQVASCQRALSLNPQSAGAHFELGKAYLNLGKREEALTCFQQSVAIKADDAETYYHLGYTYSLLGRFHEAIANCRQALNLRPDYAEAHNNIGYARLSLGDLDAAVASFRQAVAAKPDYAKAHFNLGLGLINQGRVVEALPLFRKVIELTGNGAGPNQRRGELRSGDPADLEVQAYSAEASMALYLPSTPPADLNSAHWRFAQRFEAPLKPLWPRHANTRDAERRLKVGYVSPDFRLHSVAYFMEPILAHHDKREVEIYCYYSYGVHDAVTERLMAYADHWLPCQGITDQDLAARIQADGIDILVDLAGHTAGNRLLMFAYKPAPVQVSYLGYVATTGLTAMDYRLSHIDADPEGNERYNSEQLYRLPRSLWCYRPPADMPAVATETPARRNGYITFGSMNNIAKVSDPAIALWSRLLQALPSSRLIMAGVPLGTSQQRILARFAAHGITAGRIELHPKLSHQSFRELHHRIDIALDAFPHNGNTTTCESLWMGVPVLNLIGGHFVARFGYMLLKSIGLEALAGRDEEEYLAIAGALAQDLPRLEGLRAGMRSRIESSALRDEAGLTRDIEAAYRAMWRAWCRSVTEGV